MKNTTILLIAFLFGPTVLQAQIQLKPLESGIGMENNTYYKDINNVLDGFVGTYEYNGADFYFKIKLVKRTMKSRNNGGTWWDMLEGTYQYNKDGIEVNYLNDAFDNSNARIDIVRIRKIDDGLQYFCPNCLVEKWLDGLISDRINNRIATLYIAKRIVNGEEGLQLGFLYTLEAHHVDDPLPAVAHLPEGKFFVRKIN